MGFSKANSRSNSIWTYRLITFLAISSDNEYIISGSSDQTIQIWSFVSKTQIAVLCGHTPEIACLVITSDNKFIFSGSGKFLIKWDLKMGNELWRYNNESSFSLMEAKFLNFIGDDYSHVLSIGISPDNNTLVSGSGDKKIRLLNISDGTLYDQFKIEGHELVTVAFTSDGKLIASSSI